MSQGYVLSGQSMSREILASQIMGIVGVLCGKITIHKSIILIILKDVGGQRCGVSDERKILK